ncbi:Rab-GTPase-TBC domain-containing protein [Artemisia annua]|uniref:Rab-GTPase-TBC domain-containing protein n=1 Tax=Artemisia annua TaxID=35608 RepID=A0A2U1LBZ3_ARTAN|nr:Rab-GTPase-TBC domain-containing protein [Artemisia annua]
MTKPILNPSSTVSLEHKRDAYGFAVRPQHVQRYREYSSIYKVEEEERSDRWKDFLQRQSESAQLPEIDSTAEESKTSSLAQVSGQEVEDSSDKVAEGDDLGDEEPGDDDAQKEEVPPVFQAEIWSHIRPSLQTIENIMNARVRKKIGLSESEKDHGREKPALFEDARPAKAGIEDDSEEEFYDMERSVSDPTQNVSSSDGVNTPTASTESASPCKDELECLVQGGVPMALRGELWQAFVGVKARHIENYYQNLLDPDTKNDNSIEDPTLQTDKANQTATADSVSIPEKWKAQIEKDLPRTFPGHPALDDDGRNALRRILTAYARHNPSVGYCQAMNFFAGLLLLLMPEENAFWALMGILDDYFEGYYTEEMTESQVDQLVFEELVRERFPKLVNHLDYLGVQVAWVSGPWFLSMFMNMLPWESVLRIWDVLLFQGNRVMLFRTALALMEFYGPALVTTKDAGDAITLLQSLAGSTFDSSQLVLTACMGYHNVTESRLQVLRDKHRPTVEAALEERSKGLRMLRGSKGLVAKLCGSKENKMDQIGDKVTNGELSRMNSESSSGDELYMGASGDAEIDSVPDLQEQILWLKNELCTIIEEKRSSTLRAEELETALMEMVKQDNRRQLSTKVEKLEREVAELHQALSCKQEQENAMLQVLMRVEQEQRVTEDARIYAEQDAAAQRYAAQVLQEKYEAATTSLAEMEERLVMAESMLEATLQYQSGQHKSQPSPRSTNQDPSAIRTSQEHLQDIPARRISLLSRPFGLGWLDKNKDKSAEESNQVKSSDELKGLNTLQKDINGLKMEELSVG